MRQAIDGQHDSDGAGNPAGGVTRGNGIEIRWQSGPLGRHTPDCVPGGCEPACTRVPQNGAFVEGVIAAALDRLEYYQRSRFRCRENALAITKLEEALHWLQHRTVEREVRAVEGTHAE